MKAKCKSNSTTRTKTQTKARTRTRTQAQKHPGFKAVQSRIAKKQGVSEEAAGAILASSARKASPAAKRKNPRLKRVK